MKNVGRSLLRNISQRWWISLPFILALATLVFLIWSASLAISTPYDGIPDFSSNNPKIQVDPGGPAFNKLRTGDVVKSIDHVPFKNAFPLYRGKQAGEKVEFEVERGDLTRSVTITLVDPPLAQVLVRLVPLFVALIFWGIGVGLQAFRTSDRVIGVFFVWCQVSALMLAAGAASSQGPPWASSLFTFLLWWVGPLSVHFHFHFPQTIRLAWKRLFLFFLYALAALGGLPYLIWGSETIRLTSSFSQIISFNRIYLAFNLIMVVGLLVYAYLRETSPGARGKIRIVVLGGTLSAIPLVTLTILPGALSQTPIIPYAYAFLFLGILPLTYGYAIFRHRLIEIERHINRGATYILVYSILGAFYLVLYAFINRLVPPDLSKDAFPLINTLLVLVLASVFVPLHHRVQRFVDTLFYGGWYDYRSAVTQITQGMEQVTDLKTLAITLGERLVRTLHLEDTCVFLRDLDGNFSVIEVAPRSNTAIQGSQEFPTLPMSSLTFLLKMGGEVSRTSLRKALSEVSLTPEEHQLLNSEQDHLWVPVIGHGQIQGLIALGPKFGGDIFSSEDLDILHIVARQTGPVMENIHLLTRLRQHAAGLERRVKERTAELHDAKERVEAILASVGDGVIVIDLEGNIQTVNTAFEEQSGFMATELAGIKLVDLLAEQNEPATLEELHSSFAKGHVWSGELIAKRKGGSLYDIQLTMAPVRDQGEQIISYVGSQRDITHQKELDRLKDQFVSDVSHELRTPTTNIGLYLELLEYATPERQETYVRVLKEQSQLLRELVEEILDLSRLSVGKSKGIEFSAVDLNVLVEQVITAHRPLAEAAGLNLYFEPSKGLPPARGEQNQLARVITNLVANAVRYTLQGEVLVRTFGSNGQVCLEVCDTGIGIDAEDIPHLFERFYRGKQVRQSQIHGTGLGLAIVKEIIELHDGRVEINSTVGKGSDFIVRIPILEG